MAPNTSITSDQSTVELPPVIVTAPPPSSGAGSNPSDVIGPLGGAGTQLVYPSDRPKYFMKFDIHNYKRANLLEVGDLGNALNSIVLPLPSNLVDATQERWQDDFSVGQLTGGLINGLGVPLANAIRNGTFGPISDAISNGTGSIANQLSSVSGARDAAGAVLASGSGQISGAVQSLVGLAPNQFITVLFVSPVFKRFEFTWGLAPHSKAESVTLRKMANVFKNAMAPGLDFANLMWTFPNIFKISFHPNSRSLFKFKPAVLEAFSVNYTPSGRASFLADPNPGAGENAPTTMYFNMRFLEIEQWTGATRQIQMTQMTHTQKNEAKPEKQPEPPKPPMPSLLDIKEYWLRYWWRQH